MANMIVGVCTPENFSHFDRMLSELRGLAEALDLSIDYEMTQNLDECSQTSYIGKGKVAELISFINNNSIDYCIFNDELTSNQYNYLCDALNCEVLDRTGLILAIFEKRAHTKEAILQVKIAKLNYQLPRLVGGHADIIGQLGGSGFRGAGETQLELDRRLLYTELARLKKELKQVVLQRQTQRKKRKDSLYPIVALVGYTNSGKSTLMNALLNNNQTDKKVFEKDMLFATLQTSTRTISNYQEFAYLLTDTVGFIDYLPHVLIESFKSTLEEITEASLLLHVVDLSNEEYLNHIKVTNDVLTEIGVEDIPMIYIFNKIDKVESIPFELNDPHILLSAKNKDNLDELKDYIQKTLYPHAKKVTLHIPYEDGEVYSLLSSKCHIIHTAYSDCIEVVCEVLPNLLPDIKDYIVEQ